MPSPKLIPEALSGKYRILITNTQSKLSQEITRQLNTKTQVEIVQLLDQINPIPTADIDVILHVAGFDATSLSQTISFTSYLHSLLDIARDCHAKFFLIVPQTPSVLIKTAVTFVSQFSKAFSINYQVVEIVEDDVFLEAEAIIRKIIKNHRAPPATLVLPKTKLPSPPLRPISMKPKGKLIPVGRKSKRPLFSKSHIKYSVVILMVIFFPWFLTLLQVFAAPQFLKCSSNSLRAGQLNRSRTCSQISTHLTQGLNITSRVSLFSPQIFAKVGLPLEPLVSAFLHMSNSLNLAADLTERYTNALAAFLGKSDSLEQLDTSRLTYNLTSLSEQLAYLQSDLRDLYLSSSKPPQFINPLAAQVSQNQALITKVQKITHDLPALLSYHRKSTYLVLVQDNTELRATGGFIDSFILFTAEDGRLSDIQLFSSSLADSRLKGQVEPPADLKAILGESSWYLRDSNWDPDFSVSAQKAAWFVEKELSRPVDVVMAINWSAIQTVLKLTGPLSFSKSGPQFTSANVLSQYITQIEPSGSANDQSFITKIVQKIINSSENLNSSQIISLLVSLLNLADSRQLLVFPVTFDSPALKVAGWSGEVSPVQCLSQNLCFQDYFYVVHTNVGINKSDYYVSPQTKISVDLKPNTASYLINLTLKNASPQSSWPTGKYRDYLRIYLPQNTSIDSVKVNNQDLHLGQYSVTFTNGLPVLGLVVEVFPGATSEVAVTAHKNVNLSDLFHYQLYLPNQPGLLKSPTTLDISYPSDWPATVYKQPAVASMGQLQYNALGDNPIQIDVDFSANK